LLQLEALCVALVFEGASAKHDDLTEFRTKACMSLGGSKSKANLPCT